jgi:FkbM family methyltransferase
MKFENLKKGFRAGEITKPDFIARALEQHRLLFDYVAVTRTTEVREIRIGPQGVSFQLGDEGIWLLAPPEEARVAPIEAMNFDRYEPQETLVMDLLASRASQILDVGANIGWYAVRFARRMPGAQVHAFEPIPSTYGYLQHNVKANAVGDQVRTYNCGLSEKSGTVEFFISPTSGTNASLLNVAGADDARGVTGSITTLDEWASLHGVAPEFIKCDVEGAELLVFRGGRNTLERHRPAVFAELLRKWSKPFGYHPNDVLAFFAEMGYLCFAVGAQGVRRASTVTEETVETNFAFVHPAAHAESLAALQASESASDA